MDTILAQALALSTFPLSAEIALYIDLQLKQCLTIRTWFNVVLHMYYNYILRSEQCNLVYHI